MEINLKHILAGLTAAEIIQVSRILGYSSETSPKTTERVLTQTWSYLVVPHTPH